MKLPVWPEPSKINKIYLGLERIRALLAALGNPEKQLSPVFHIAGTNGKGSVSSFLKYILEENGYSVNRLTSPHLVRFNERIEVAGKEIEDDYYYRLASECRAVIENNRLSASYFEIITAIAFMAFSRCSSDATILEVGMGGRLDATNVIDSPLVSIITSISLDHVHCLGDTVEKIALEKIAIAKSGRPIVIAKQKESVEKIMREAAQSLNCPIYSPGKDWEYLKFDDSCRFIGFGKEIETPIPGLEGRHQLINAAAAIASLLCQDKLKITDGSICRGIKNTRWRARLQNLKGTIIYSHVDSNSELYLDAAHNEGGASALLDWLNDRDEKNKMRNILIICMLQRKDSRSFIKILGSRFSERIIVSNSNEEYKTPEEFTREFEDIGLDVHGVYTNVVEALEKTKNIGKPGERKRILICGSLYFCGEVLSLIEDY
ncbi:MAG: bifunctional folylpolyglutamate synthase/dihydrofolate synthase [Rickettsiales bacterium]|jgi:dihydrofolate synthase/folylpolyglutamate synthase|nr:bifunctional folylpolyglutamate synthase/dihydrofolate synthase [Rickettsiales bacterium]